MRIAVIAPPRFPIKEPFGGGLEAQAWTSCAALTARGVHVEVYGAEGSDFAAPDLAFPVPDWGSTPASDTTLPPTTARAHERLMHELMDRLAANERGFDLVHNHCLYPQPLARAAELPVPLVTTLHTRPFVELTEVLDGDNGEFVAVSDYLRGAWGMLRPAPQVIHNSIDLSRWKLGRGGDDLVWFGRIVPEKAPHLAIDAAKLAGTRLLLAGRVGDEAYFRAQIEPRLGAHASYLGALRHSELAAVVGRCRVALVTPTSPEPFGLVAAEAAACGTPVVAFDIGGLREVVINGVTGMTVPVGDVDAMASAVTAVGRLRRAQVHREVRHRFGIATMTESYLRLYDDLISARQQTTA